MCGCQRATCRSWYCPYTMDQWVPGIELRLSHFVAGTPSLLTRPVASSPYGALLVSDYSKGFGGKYGIDKDKVDKSAVGFEYQGKTEKHESQKGTCHFTFLSPAPPRMTGVATEEKNGCHLQSFKWSS